MILKNSRTLIITALFTLLLTMTLIYQSKYKQQQEVTAAQAVTIAGLQHYRQVNENNNHAAIKAEGEKRHATFNSEQRIEALAQQLENTTCANTHIDARTYQRLRERADSLRHPAKLTG